MCISCWLLTKFSSVLHLLSNSASLNRFLTTEGALSHTYVLSLEIGLIGCRTNKPYWNISNHSCSGAIFFTLSTLQYIPRNMHTVFALLCFVVVIHWLIFPYPSGLLHWHCGNLTIAPVPAKQPWWIWINTSCEFIMNDCMTTTKQSTTKPCAYFLGYTVSTLGIDYSNWRVQRIAFYDIDVEYVINVEIYFVMMFPCFI